MAKEVRVCENCGFSNDVSSLECVKCGYDLSFIIPTEEIIAAENSGNAWTFTAKDDEDLYFSVNDEVFVGAECEILQEYFSKSKYVSRRHARIFLQDGKIFVNDASTNGTFVNGNRINKMENFELKNGDEITFADISFRISGDKIAD
ncbi:MAG: FHA domain-containing protein [Oscillospiraceae bacterium]